MLGYSRQGMRSPARPPAGAWDAGVSDLLFPTLARPVLQSPPLPPPPPLAVQVGLLVPAWMMETMRWPAGVRMGLAVGRSQEPLQAALGRRWNCGRSNISLVMILSVVAAMRVEAASSVLSAEGGCWVTACRVMRSPARPPAGAWDAGVSDLLFSR